ncbi:DNA-binding response regulator [Nitratireductor sp. ZSWI3]|uniref:DNA-binding response regulator n=1 Tax=Nitratireductor sp. ZSWI3 TaxID=2966359 RepID=UPI0021500F98|nr:DNA-binding response regulator [Nitratireductor sp. ZSWI3]MCR4269132.1 DNA-binding response regulator [Nitratireductor sp. ZSWI3]
MHATILVVAPDSAFRLSLRFMLESEGYEVEVLNGLTDLRLLRPKAHCLIIDHEILERQRMPVAALLEEGGPVIVLADIPVDTPADPRLRMIEKPLLGGTVVRAVHDLLSGTVN